MGNVLDPHALPALSLRLLPSGNVTHGELRQSQGRLEASPKTTGETSHFQYSLQTTADSLLSSVLRGRTTSARVIGNQRYRVVHSPKTSSSMPRITVDIFITDLNKD